MERQLSIQSKKQLHRFCWQYLQIQPELDYPEDENLRNDAFQRALNARLFEENAVEFKPPQRYQLKVLKELTRRIEESILDWEEEV